MKHRILSAAISVALGFCCAAADAAVYAEVPNDAVITGIKGYTDDFTALETLSVPYGTAFDELGLPDKLTAYLSDGTEKDVSVTWTEADGEYGVSEYDSFDFIPSFSEEEVFADTYNEYLFITVSIDYLISDLDTSGLSAGNYAKEISSDIQQTESIAEVGNTDADDKHVYSDADYIGNNTEKSNILIKEGTEIQETNADGSKDSCNVTEPIHQYDLTLNWQNADYQTNRNANTWDHELYKYTLTSATKDLDTGNVQTSTQDIAPSVEKVTKYLNVYPGSLVIGNVLTTSKPTNAEYTYNYDQTTGQKLFDMDSIAWDTFFEDVVGNLKNADGTWKYDGIYFGAADGNSRKDFTAESLSTLQDFIDSGRAMVMGHDVPLYHYGFGWADHTNAWNFFQPIFGLSDTAPVLNGGSTIYISDDSGSGNFPDSVQTSGNMMTEWPYRFVSGSTAGINPSHMLQPPSLDKINIWATYDSTVKVWNSTYSANAYLFSSKEYPNVAMSQAGHSTPSENDYKLIVDMLMYIAPAYNAPQLSASVSVQDGASPVEPDITSEEIISTGNISSAPFHFEAADQATEATFALQQEGQRTGTAAEDIVQLKTVTLLSQTERYFYSVDTDINGTPSYTNDCNGIPSVSGTAMETDAVTLNGRSNTVNIDLSAALNADTTVYLHVVAVDRAGNVSAVSTYGFPNIEVEPAIEKLVTGSDIVDSSYSFKMTSEDPLFPMPDDSVNHEKTVTIDGAGTAAIGSIAFFQAGTYTYKISEIAGNQDRCIYDGTVYTMTVEVKRDGINMEASAVYSGGSSNDKAVFNNVYTALAGPSLVTFLDCKGNTVKIEWVEYGQNATAPEGYGTYEGIWNVTSHRDLRPSTCSINTARVIPNTGTYQ